MAELDPKADRDLLSNIIEVSGDVLIMLSADGRILEFNAEAEQLFGRTRGEVLGESYAELFLPAEVRQPVEAEIGKVLAGQSARGFVNEVIGAGGVRRAVSWNGKRVVDANGVKLGVIAAGRDVTEQREAKRELQRAESRLQSIFRAAPSGIGMTTGRVLVEVNQRVCDMSGYTVDELLGKSARILYPSDEAFERVAAESHAQYKAHGIGTVEASWCRKDGSIINVLVSSTPIDQDDWSLGVTFTALDITARMSTEAKLRNTLQTSADILRHIPAGLFLYQYRAPDSLTLLDGNEEARRLTRINVEQSRGAEFNDLWPQAQVSGFTDALLRVMETGQVYATEEFAYKDETLAGVYRIRGFRIPGDRLGVAFEDVTAQKRAEMERDRFFDLSLDLMSITGTDGSLRHVSSAWQRILGWSEAELLHRSLFEFVHPDDLTATIAANKQLQEGESLVAFENRIRCRDGAYRRISWNSYPLPQEALVYSVARDITEKVAMESQLRQSQKMEAVGQLAGGVAHDFNNILTSILGNADLALDELKDQLEEGSTLLTELQDIEHSARRASELTRQLLAFSRRQLSQPRILDLNGTVAKMERMLGRLITEDIRLEFNYAHGLSDIYADPGQIEQVVMNLVVNARDAMKGGGTLTVATTNVDLTEPFLFGQTNLRPGPHVMLAVSDNGSGMSSEVMERVFEPFFTTKNIGEGTGLGLATVYGLVKQADGHIAVDSEPGRGSTFRVYLPVSKERLEPVHAVSQAEQGSVGSERILVCEDDSAVRELIVRILAQAGYQTIAADRGSRALELAGECGHDFELLITDVIMPDLNGRNLADQLSEIIPSLRTLFVSGYTADVIAHHGVLDEGVEFLEKPFSRQKLLRRVREVLDG